MAIIQPNRGNKRQKMATIKELWTISRTMKKRLYILFFLTLLSCNKKEVGQISQKLNGFWFSEEKILLIRDSVMLHPFYEVQGFFEYVINNEILIVKINEGYLQNVYDTGFLKLNDQNKLTLIFDNDTSTFEKYKSFRKGNFQKLTFKAGPCHGDCPVFNVEIFASGLVNFNGKAYTAKIGTQQYNISQDAIKEINDLLDIVEIRNYHKNDFSNFSGFSGFNLVVEYPDGSVISILDGLFEGKYENVIKYFYYIERELMKNSP